MQVKTQNIQAVCPICSSTSSKVHSNYQRSLLDVSWGNYQVCLKLSTQKLFCSNSNCERRIFTIRLPKIAAPWARRTERLNTQLIKVGLAQGGLPGSRLTQHLGIKISRQTLLRLVMKMPLPSHGVPKVLGVDDWAYRKRHTYGTILVDLETRQPIDLLSDRTATTLAEWLQEHPGIEIISRDRAKAYKEGASRGCPEAIQVADRFHLLQNLAQMLEVVLNQHRTLLKNVEDETNNCPIVESEKIVAQPIQPPPNPVEALKLAKVRREQRKEKYDQVWALHKKGYRGKAIARHLGIGKSTVFRYLRSPTFPERKGRSDKGRGKVSPFKKYLLERWNSGFHDTQKLYIEIKEQGYEGSYVTLARYTRRLRQAQGFKPRQKASKSLPIVFEPKKSLMTVRQAVWLILRYAINQNEAETEAIELLKKQHLDLNTGISLAMDFADLVRRKQPDLLALWLKKAEESGIRAITGFATKLKDDLDAVRNGVTYQWSNGQVEGQVNRLKM
ncbi:MAG: ISL3 family transposase, partial [Waterburya sp.]